jgi:hypothetical protein
MDIHLLYKNTVIRSLSLQTDPKLVLNRSRVSILFVFDYIPNEELISQLERLGEPIPIVLKIENAMQANEMREKMETQYDRVAYWLQNKDGDDLISSDREAALNRLEQFQEVFPNALMLHHNPSRETSIEDKKELISKTQMTFIDVSNALILQGQLRKTSFFESLDKLRSKQGYSTAIITGSETNLSWFSQKLPDLKKAGVIITPPPKTNL